MKPIGGYFELELTRGEEYHKHAIRLNTGRNSLEYILRVKEYRTVHIPYFICESLLEPLRKLSVKPKYYHIVLNIYYEIHQLQMLSLLRLLLH